jgi:Uma2 family endonuclease
MSTAAQLMTADELWRLPDDGMRHELIRGELTTMPPSGAEHGGTTVNLATPLDQHARSHDLGRVLAAETGFVLARDPDTVRAADVAFVEKGRIPRGGLPREFFPGAPNLAVEVVSPSDTLVEVQEKVEEWLTAGAQMVWVVNPRNRTVTVYRSPTKPIVLTANDELDGQDVVPGFRIRVSELFT